ALEVTVENRGTRPAVDCQGIITFPKIEALVLHPQTREHVVDTKASVFTLQPKASMRLVAAWNYSTGGVIDGTEASLTPGEFLDLAIPAQAVIRFGKKEIVKALSREAVEQYFREAQLSSYLYKV
ncbi:MAG: hypothetical protein AB1744_14495, partial [Candidatus Zixiibacteriota bacterium]